MEHFFKNRFQEFLFIAVILLAFITFNIETDIYTPSFPQMMSYFDTNEEMIQLLLSVNFLGLCLSCLFFGPASDAYGRKPILFSGLLIFMLSSVGCALTDSLNAMIFCRFLQGIGCGAIVSAGLTLFFDVFPAEKSSRLVSICNGTLGGVMALAPIVGNWISLYLGWRMNFYLIAFLAALSFFSIWFFIKETLPPEKRTQIKLNVVLKNYFSILRNFPFMAHTLIWCLTFGMIIVFIANLSLIFVDYLGVPKEDFGVYQAAIMATYFVGSMGGAYLIKKIGMIPTKILGSVGYIMGIILLIGLSFFNPSPLWLIVAMSIASLGSALAMTIYFTYSMTHLGDSLRGSAMSLTQSIRLLVTSGLVWIAAASFDGTTKPLSLLAMSSLILSTILYGLLYERKQHLAKANLV